MRIKDLFYILNKTANPGMPMVHIRMADKGEEKTSEEIAKDVLQYNSTKKLILFGPEPLTQQLAIIDLVGRCLLDRQLIINTTGGIMPDYNLRNKVHEWHVFVPDTDKTFSFDYNPDAMFFFLKQKNVIFHFRIQDQDSADRLNQHIIESELDLGKIVIHPEVMELDQMPGVYKATDKVCLEHGIRRGSVIKLWARK